MSSGILEPPRASKKWCNNNFFQRSEARYDSTRHFPFGFRLEPIQARNVSSSNNLRLPRVLTRGDSSTFSSLRPRFLGSYTWNMLL